MKVNANDTRRLQVYVLKQTRAGEKSNFSIDSIKDNPKVVLY